MKSEWRVTNNVMMGDKTFGVYRLIDIDVVDHSGNREFQDIWHKERCDAMKVAKRLNESGGNSNGC